MQITYLLMASKNIDFEHVCHVIITVNFLIRAHDCDVWINYFCPKRQFQVQSEILSNLSYFLSKATFLKKNSLNCLLNVKLDHFGCTAWNTLKLLFSKRILLTAFQM